MRDSGFVLLGGWGLWRKVQFKLLEEGGEWWSLPENISEESKSTWHYFDKKKKPYFSEGYRHMIMWYSVRPLPSQTKTDGRKATKNKQKWIKLASCRLGVVFFRKNLSFLLFPVNFLHVELYFDECTSVIFPRLLCFSNF